MYDHSQIHLFIHPYLPIQLPILPFTYPQGHSSIHHVSKFCLSIHSFIHPLIHQSNHLSKHLFILFSYPHNQPSINIFTELSARPSIHLFTHLFSYPSTCLLPTHLSIYPLIQLSTLHSHLSIHHPSVHRFVHPSAHPFICLPFHSSIHLPTLPPMHPSSKSSSSTCGWYVPLMRAAERSGS